MTGPSVHGSARRLQAASLPIECKCVSLIRNKICCLLISNLLTFKVSLGICNFHIIKNLSLANLILLLLLAKWPQFAILNALPIHQNRTKFITSPEEVSNVCTQH